MNNNVIKLIAFTAGMAVGSTITWMLLKTKYEQIAQEEIDSVKEMLASTKNNTVFEDEKPDISVYTERLKELNYASDDEEKGESTQMSIDDPYVIPPEEFDTLDDYNTCSLTYYADGVLTDEYDEIVDDIDYIVGKDSLNHFGEFEDDSVFVRNDSLKCDYEILKDLRTYSEIHTEE